nr:MAG TPA: hypothetical protein [Caudoviricetes sp.]
MIPAPSRPRKGAAKPGEGNKINRARKRPRKFFEIGFFPFLCYT